MDDQNTSQSLFPMVSFDWSFRSTNENRPMILRILHQALTMVRNLGISEVGVYFQWMEAKNLPIVEEGRFQS